MLSHRNIITNILQMYYHEKPARQELGVETQTSLGILPLGHIYGLTLVAQVAQFRGDRVIIMPRFELDTFLNAIQTYGVQHLPVVPPVVLAMLNNKEKCKKYDLSSVRLMMSGAAPMGEEAMVDLLKQYPKWSFSQAYG